MRQITTFDNGATRPTDAECQVGYRTKDFAEAEKVLIGHGYREEDDGGGGGTDRFDGFGRFFVQVGTGHKVALNYRTVDSIVSYWRRFGSTTP